MPTVTLANSIGQPTTEVQAQTQKVRFTPVTVNNTGSVTPAKEIPAAAAQVEQPKTLEAAVEAKETEKAPEVTKSDTKDPKKMQDEERMNAIIRREKAMRAKIRESEAEIAKYKAQAQELEQAKAREEQYKLQESQRQERLQADPVGYLTEQGFTADQITQALINQPGPESQAVKQLSEKILKLEREQQAALKRQEDEASTNYQNAIKTIQKNVDKLVANNPEFETIRASEASKSVTTYIEKVWKEEGVMLDIEEAAVEIEEYLTEQALNLAKLTKIQNKLRPATPKEAPKAAAQAQKPVTLTNKTNNPTRPLSARERAILAFKRELK